MVQTSDVLEVLLPGTSETGLRRARSVVQFLRLLAADTQPSRASSVGVGLEKARVELEAQERARIGAALRDLLRHHLVALASADSFLAWGEPSAGHGAAWRVLDEFREQHPWLADVPRPGEPASRSAACLLESAERLPLDADEVTLWKSRILRFAEGPRAAEALLRARLEAGASGPGAARPDPELGACLVECLLDRGAVREARSWLQDPTNPTAADPRLRQLLCWTLLCVGDYAGAKSAIVGCPVFTGVLPASLVDLRSDRPEWLPCLAGRAPQDPATIAAKTDRAVPARDRSEAGAVLLAVFAIEPGGQTIAVHVDAAPALRARLPDWLADRDGAYSVPGENEHELVIRARAVTVRKEGVVPIAGALGRDSSLALALAPILDDHGEVAGWLHVECEHHRLPGRRRLAAMAGSWRNDVLARAPRPSALIPVPGARSGDDWSGGASETSPECAAVFEALVADLGIKTAQRKWWGFVVEQSPEIRLVATGGEGTGLSSGARGNGRAVTRAAATRSVVSFESPDARLSLDERAASGVVLPLLLGGELCGLLAIESSRRRDFREADLTRIAESTEPRGLDLRLARFAAWHRRKFGFEVCFDRGVPGYRAFVTRLCAAAASRSPVVFSGPGGSGRTILARWLHFESPSSSDTLRFVDCATLATREDLRERLEAGPEGSLVLEGLEGLAPECQEELLRWLEERESRSEDSPALRILGTLRAGGADDDGATRLREDLASRLDRLRMRVAPLRERRGDVLALVAGCARRFAEAERVRMPEFSDETLALLWRQPWEGNARELENFVFKLVVFGPGRKRGTVETVEPAHVESIAAEFGLRLVARLPSRHPSRADLISALRITRKPGGRWNKTRAALYLGWDPDTLVARMQDAGIGDEVPLSADDAGWTTETAVSSDGAEDARLAPDRAYAPDAERAASADPASIQGAPTRVAPVGAGFFGTEPIGAASIGSASIRQASAGPAPIGSSSIRATEPTPTPSHAPAAIQVTSIVEAPGDSLSSQTPRVERTNDDERTTDLA